MRAEKKLAEVQELSEYRKSVIDTHRDLLQDRDATILYLRNQLADSHQLLAHALDELKRPYFEYVSPQKGDCYRFYYEISTQEIRRLKVDDRQEAFATYVSQRVFRELMKL